MSQQIGTASSVTLAARYWRGAGEDLVTLGYATRMRRRKGCPRWYRILKVLPEKKALAAEVDDHYTHGVDEWLKGVEAELRALKSEMSAFCGGIQGTGLDSTKWGRRIARAVGAVSGVLESIDHMPHLPAPLCVRRVTVQPRDLFVSCCHRKGKRRHSKMWRAREVCSVLDAIARAASELEGRDRRAKGLTALIRDVERKLEDTDIPMRA